MHRGHKNIGRKKVPDIPSPEGGQHQKGTSAIDWGNKKTKTKPATPLPHRAFLASSVKGWFKVLDVYSKALNHDPLQHCVPQ
jgi:hypothetical protein